MHFKRTIQQFTGAVSLSLLLALPAFALELGEAKSAGQIGETNSGYVAAVKPTTNVIGLVTSINKKRKAQYEKIADENGISLQAVEARAGVKALENTPKGQYINTGKGWEIK